jgi:hypothetical protein
LGNSSAKNGPHFFDNLAVCTISGAPVNQPPSVNAGPDLNITLPASATLNGTVTDDGLPPNLQLAISWTKVSGSGIVSFVNSHLAATTASFDQPGTYVLRL